MRIPIFALTADLQQVRSDRQGAQIEVNFDSYGEVPELCRHVFAKSDSLRSIDQPNLVPTRLGTDREQYGRSETCAWQGYGLADWIAGLTACDALSSIVDEEELSRLIGAAIAPRANAKIAAEVR